MSALEKRTGQSVLKATPVPSALGELGIRIGLDEGSGMAVVVIPPQVRQSLNVLDPVSSFAQADPNWTPSVRVVALDPSKDGPHFYEQAGRKLAPTKQALELLAKAAGNLYTRTTRIPRSELADGEALGMRATLGIRRSDGSIEEVTREKTWVEEAERAEIEEAVDRAVAWENGQRTNKPKFTGPERDREIRKRWLAEIKNRAAKTESKAVLRAIRAALQIPHTFSPADAAKPFLVIGFSFTPDYSDEDTRRLLVAAGLNAQAAIYGGDRTVSREIEAPATPHEPEENGTGPEGEDAGQQAEAAVEDSPPPPAASVPDDEDAALAAEFGAGDVAAAKVAADEGGAFVLPEGTHKGKTVFQVAAGTGGEKRIKMLLKLPNHKAHAAALAFASHYLPEVLAAAEQEAQAAKEVAA